MAGIDNGVLDRAEVEQSTAVCCKVLAGTNQLRLSVYIIGSKYCFLCGNANHVEDATGNVLTNTTVCVGQLSLFCFSGRWKLQHILFALVLNANLFSVGSSIGVSKQSLADGKIRQLNNLHRNLTRR